MRVLEPFLFTIGTVIVAVPILQRRAAKVGASRLPAGLLIAQVTMAVLALAIIQASPDEPDWDNSGMTCKDIDRSSEALLYALLIGSSVAGGLAWATTSVGGRDTWPRVIGYATLAVVVPYVILARWAWVSLCGWN